MITIKCCQTEAFVFLPFVLTGYGPCLIAAAAESTDKFFQDLSHILSPFSQVIPYRKDRRKISAFDLTAVLSVTALLRGLLLHTNQNIPSSASV